LARLVIVIDEFAALAEELPAFVSGLVGIAQRGRSLGVHLVLATQRPAGVVSAEIRANTALRIALRVTDPGESIDVIGADAAAVLSRRQPGRALLRTGSALTLFQVGRIAAPARAAGESTNLSRRASGRLAPTPHDRDRPGGRPIGPAFAGRRRPRRGAGDRRACAAPALARCAARQPVPSRTWARTMRRAHCGWGSLTTRATRRSGQRRGTSPRGAPSSWWERRAAAAEPC
jgi:hypothetical protein